MQAVNIRQLKTNPSSALAAAREDDMVVVINRDNPQAIIVDLERLGVADLPSVRVALAAALFRNRAISAGLAARIARKPLAEMLSLFSGMGISLTKDDDQGVKETLGDIETGRAWLKAGA
jgi:antitoxin (DNA-binding transcriptional repressor) of toxin-antitoxin stability system